MIIRLILIVIATILGLVVLNWFWQFLKASQANARRERLAPRVGEPMVQDPQCRTYLPQSAALQMEIDGQRHYFCSRQCADRYQERMVAQKGA
ncbi:MAG: YHS domain-containing protein [Nitrospirota bacterium]